MPTQGIQKKYNRVRDRSFVDGSMKRILNHDDVDKTSFRSGGKGMVNKDLFPTYRKN